MNSNIVKIAKAKKDDWQYEQEHRKFKKQEKKRRDQKRKNREHKRSYDE